MPSLAQSIIDTARNMQSKRGKEKVRDSFNNAYNRHLQSAAMYSFASQIQDLYSGVPQLAKDLMGAMRYSIDKDVADAAAKMDKTSTKNLLDAFKFAKPPYPKTWIEFRMHDMYVGWLISEKGDELQVSHTKSHQSTNHTPIINYEANTHFINKDGFRYFNPDIERKIKAREELTFQNPRHTSTGHQEYICRIALTFMLLLNSRSPIFEITEPNKEESRRNNNIRRIHGLPAEPPMHNIRFDVARILRQRGDITSEEASKLMAASLVRGHFKVRQTGVFFWSPYVRNARDDEHRAAVQAADINSERRYAIKTGLSALPGPSISGLEPV